MRPFSVTDFIKEKYSEVETRKQKQEASLKELVKIELKEEVQTGAEVKKDWDQNVGDVLRPFSGTDFIKEEYSEVETRKQKQEASLKELVTKIELKKEV